MPWPTPQDYQEAMQNPSIAFTDPQLRSGRAEENQLGLPRPICGAFASVYKVVGGGRTWAVRCFLKEFQDQQQRYAAISAQLARTKLPFTVGFDFVPQGIRVRGSWYPVLKMEWVQGESLVRFVSNNLQSPQSLLSLGLGIVEAARALRDAGVAHGDLQHGNILVVNGKPKLIDYDGMYVPDLRGWGSHEVGHPNYQHPARKEQDFGPGLDNFSIWVIYLSLVALSVRPDLWGRFRAGDECLLLRRSDFEWPNRSPLLRELERLPDARTQSLAVMFRSLLPLSPLQVPLLDVSSFTALGQRGPATGSDWLKDHVPARRAGTSPASTHAATQPPPDIDASWILDSGQDQEPALPIPSFQNSFISERLVLFWTGPLLVVLLLLAATQVFPVLACAVMATSLFLANLGYWKYRHATDGCVGQLRSLRHKVQDLQQGVREAQRAVSDAERDRRAEVERMAKAERQVRAQLSGIPVQEQREMGETDLRKSSQLNGVALLRSACRDKEHQELRQLQGDVAQVVADIDRRIAGLAQAEQDELSSALKARQEQHVLRRLQSAPLSNATISGIGPKLRERLLHAGFRTAADITWRVLGVRDIGSQRGHALLAWQRSVEQRARATSPTSLPTDEVAAIRARYRQEQESLQSQRRQAQQRLKDSELSVRQKYLQESDNLDRREAAIHADSQHELKAIRDRHSSRRAQLDRELARLAQEQQASQLLLDLIRKGAEGRRRLAALSWEHARLDKQVGAMAARLTFRAYVRRIFSLR
jgi:hypothetical protein